MRTPLSNIKALNSFNGSTDEVATAKISVIIWKEGAIEARASVQRRGCTVVVVGARLVE